ncbi:MAG: ketopantoate reductase C-terminal domain-containing protein [Chthoniobacter sp.]
MSAPGCRAALSQNIEGELWAKFMCNCALNAVSALGQATYGRITEMTEARRLVEAVVEEVLAVAQAARVVLPGMADTKMALAAVLQLAKQLAGARSSTAQDLRRGKLTEIDSLNGFIARRGSELGVPTPINQALFTLIKMAEGGSLGQQK